MVIAYLMKILNYSFNDAMNLCKKQRPIVGPNDGFIRQLKDFETVCKMKRIGHETPKLPSSSYGMSRSHSYSPVKTYSPVKAYPTKYIEEEKKVS